MHKELESQFWKSRSRYQFNIDRIAEKYCGSNKRDLALEALQRNFGEACISSPVVGLKDKSYKAICRHLNKEFAKEFERHIYSNTGNTNMSRSASANNRKLRSCCCSMSGRKQFASVRKYTFNNTTPPNIVNMLTNSVKEEKYRSEVKRLRVGSVSCRVIDVITSPVKEGPVEIHYELRTVANSVLDLCDAQSSSNMERFTVAKNGKFLEAWFNNAERYWTNTNFVRDHSLRWRAAYNARRNIHHNLGYLWNNRPSNKELHVLVERVSGTSSSSWSAGIINIFKKFWNIFLINNYIKMFSVRWTVDEFIAAEVNFQVLCKSDFKMGFPINIARSLVQLFEDGCEVPFIARYRRYLIGGATPDDLRHALEAFKNAKVIRAKAEKLLKRADAEIADGFLKEVVKDALSKTMDAGELESLFEPFKKAKKGSLASRAVELGVGEICQKLRRGEYVNLELFINSKPELSTLAKVEEETMHLLSHELHRLEKTQILLEKLSELNNYLNIHLKVKSTLTRKAKFLKETDKNFSLLDHFKLYLNFEKDIRVVQPFQILALERASSKEIINWKIVVDDNIASVHPGLKLNFHFKHVDLLKKAVQDSTKRFLIPSIERKVRKKLLDRAENSAIDCFAKNLRELLLTAPLKNYAVLAIDPGYKNGCKCALVNDNGDLLQTAIFYLKPLGAKGWVPDTNAEEILKTLASKIIDLPLVIAIGNSSATREVQVFIASLIQRHVIVAKFCVVSECGASIYSATKLAEEELPKTDIKLRSAVSLARRVIDPISEYVKIAPKHLGVGLYQHSVNEKRLDEMLDIVVRECVSNVGVDVNIASLQLLQRVSGLNKNTAANIIKYRQNNGGIKSREELKNIKGIGPKCFEQCAGFLHVYNVNNDKGWDALVRKKAKLAVDYNPLDATPVHPESYKIAKQILECAGADLTHIGQNCLFQMLTVIEEQIREQGPEWIVVWELLSNPFVRKNGPMLLTNVLEMKSLKVGDVLEGIVRNHASFGIFIDLGIGYDALAHSSTLLSVVPQEYPHLEDPSPGSGATAHQINKEIRNVVHQSYPFNVSVD